jgi:triacylglycerol esterase/lipase EstA (alpha/beta hydrolase family)
LKPASKETVVLIHGLWFSGYILFVLARRLRRQGFAVYTFSYPSVRADLRVNAARLARFLDTLDADIVHLVGHSLGGILIRALFHHYPQHKPGRIVTLGTPHGGSQVAKHLRQYAFWRWVMGKGVTNLLDGLPQGWPPPTREIGTIGGNKSIGLGRILYRPLASPNDGLVSVEESSLAGARDYIVLPASHTGMLFSCAVARQVNTFLKAGHFDR